MRLIEEIDDRLRQDRADARDRLQVLTRLAFRRAGLAHGVAPLVEALIAPGELFRGDLPDMGNPEPIDQPVERHLAPRANRGEEVRDRQLIPALAFSKGKTVAPIAALEREYVGGLFDEPVLVEQLDPLFAQPLNVEGIARGKMTQPLHRLGGADEPAGAAPRHLALFAHGVAAAFRAALRKHEGLGVLWPLFHDDADDLRDHVARALHDHRVTDPNVLARDLVLIVERRARDCDAPDMNRLEFRHRRQRASPPDLNRDRL